MGIRRQAREAALQALYMCDSLDRWDAETINTCFQHFSIPKVVYPFAVRLAGGVVENLQKVNSSITCASEHWSLNRMARVDRSVLRIATFEILFLDEVPVNVAIDEAIEVAKVYGAENSPTFINGVLDRIATNLHDRISVSKIPSRERAPVTGEAPTELDSEEKPADARSENTDSEDWRLL